MKSIYNSKKPGQLKFTAWLFAILMLVGYTLQADVYDYPDSWGQSGYTLERESPTSVKLNFSITQFEMNQEMINGENMQVINVPGIFLFNDEGAPNLPGKGQYIAIPEGATASYKIIASRTEVFSGVEIAPSPRIPLDTDKGPLHYEKDLSIYSQDAFYPAKPVSLSEISEIRGVDVVVMGITPFQYNPVTKELIVYRDLQVEVSFHGGNGHFGEDRLRSRWWDPIVYNQVINPTSIPEMDYNKTFPNNSETPDYEYLIITPNNATFLQWADSIKNFRTLQGIFTGVVTTTTVGGNTVAAIENYVNTAYNTWAVAPSAVLLLGDYSTGTGGIISHFYTHPSSYPNYASDNRYADVTGNDLPDIAFARITANNSSQLDVMITKFLDYERNPPTSANFYDHPITALGWQTERWFQICSEVIGGYLKNVKGKNPVRINEIYSGSPGSVWSTATNTSTVVNYFGPSGLGYIPSSPSSLGGWSGGNSTDVINAINSGSYMLQHRDHGYYGGWGEPAFSSSNINSLTNTSNNELPYIFQLIVKPVLSIILQNVLLKNSTVTPMVDRMQVL